GQSPRKRLSAGAARKRGRGLNRCRFAGRLRTDLRNSGPGRLLTGRKRLTGGLARLERQKQHHRKQCRKGPDRSFHDVRLPLQHLHLRLGLLELPQPSAFLSRQLRRLPRQSQLGLQPLKLAPLLSVLRPLFRNPALLRSLQFTDALLQTARMRFLGALIPQQQGKQLRAARRLVAYVHVREADHTPALRHQARLPSLPVQDITARHARTGATLVVAVHLDRDPDTLPLLDHEVAIPGAAAVVREPVLGTERAEIEPPHPRQHVAYEQFLERAVLQQVPVAREPNRLVHCAPQPSCEPDYRPPTVKWTRREALPRGFMSG